MSRSRCYRSGRFSGPSARKPATGSGRARSLGIERLESRRLLTITVNTLVDELDSSIIDGDVSLRDAIAVAAAGETIVFDPALVAGGPAAINLQLGELVIRRSLTILGPGANLLAVDAQEKSRVVSVDDLDNDNLSNVGLIGLTFTGGSVTGFQYGGGIRNRENLTIIGCTIAENSTNFAGGGIWNGRGSLTIADSTLSNNSASHGAGIFTGAEANAELTTIANSTLSGNIATVSGGGLFNRDGNAEVSHSTITNNTAPSGSGVASYNSNLAQTSVYSTIIAGNHGTDVDLFGGVGINSFQSNGYNLIGDGNALGAFNNDDQTGVADAGLGPLADNGGTTFTHAVQLNSPAFNAGDPDFALSPDTDQRGESFMRVLYGRIDIGSFEAKFEIAATLVVDSLLDELDQNIEPGDVSLREAVMLANLESDAQLIEFAPALTTGGPAAIQLSLGELAILNPVSVVGPGAKLLTVVASPNSRIFDIDDGSTDTTGLIDVQIGGLSLTGGNVDVSNGGAIHNRENLTVTGAIITGNTVTGRGGGIYSRDGSLTINGCTISNNSAGFEGGGIWNGPGSLNILNSTFSGNSAGHGGGVFTAANLTAHMTSVVNSTFSGNSAETSGGGFFNHSGRSVIRHSTITLNTAPAGSGSGVAASAFNAMTTILSSIVAGNTNSDVDFVGPGVNSFISGGYNLLGGGNAVGEFNQTGDRTGVSDPKLGPLTDNGGPTPTHALLLVSPAINAGNPVAAPGVAGVPPFDQRGAGFSRVQHGRIDIGAYEALVNVGQALIVDTLVDEFDGNLGPGDLALREALWLANLDPDAQTISFAPSLTSSGPATSTLSMLELLVSNPVTITGPGANLLTINAAAQSRVFSINNANSSAVNVELRGLKLTGGNVSGLGDGGAIHNRENLSVIECIISGNTAIGGGGIYHRDGDLTVTRSTVSQNVAMLYGGGIHSRNGNLTVIDSTVSGNSATSAGGIVSTTNLTNQATNITNSTISGNTATTRGGGVLNLQGRTSIRNSTLTNNAAPVGGGGGVASLGNNSTQTSVLSSIIAGNTSSDVNFVSGGINSLVSLGYNLIGSGNGLAAFNQPGDQTGVANPQLGPLNDNGGPTRTHALLLNSPAINGGNPASMAGMDGVPAFDQRGSGFPRVIAGTIDIGALESQNPGLVVDTLADEMDGNFSPGDLSLREAIEIANVRRRPDTISFAASLTSGGPVTIALAAGEFSIQDSLTIDGPGAGRLTIDAHGESRIFNVDDGVPAQVNVVELKGLRLTRGNVAGTGNGGAILNFENLTITECIVSGSAALGGGGIDSRNGDLTISHTTFAGNTAMLDGGGVRFRDGTLVVIGSTISGNSASGAGGIFAANTGNKTTAIISSTISGNTATMSDGGGMLNSIGLVEILHSTITANMAAGIGGGVAAYGLAANTHALSSIIAGNLASDVDLIEPPGIGSFTSLGYNLVGDGNAVGRFNQTGDQTGVANPLLGPLADNGGPTATHALVIGSPAVNAGNPLPQAGTPAFDQRGSGFPRVQHGRIDIGAFEALFTVGPVLTVDTLVDELDGNIGAGDMALREALWLANLNADHQAINFASSLTSGGPATSTLALGELPISNSASINGPGAKLLTIDAAGKSRVFHISDGTSNHSDVQLRGLTLTGGNVAGFKYGGGILNRENLTLAATTVRGNSTTFLGGGIWSASGNLVVTDSTISGNSASHGAGIFSGANGGSAGTTSILSSTISGNTATVSGGGVLNMQGITVVARSTINRNAAPAGNGSGIASYGNAATQTIISSTVVSGNIQSDVDRFGGNGENSFHSNGYNLIGTGNALAAFTNHDLVGITNPQLGPLADNGGPTMTHALAAGSRAFDAGDPSAIAGMGGVPLFDQRGNGFPRVFNGRIDIGAFESQIILPALAGDYNESGVVDAADYVAWRRAKGSIVPPYTGADGNGDGEVDDDDYLVWRANFGTVLGVSSQANPGTFIAVAGALDAVDIQETSRPTQGSTNVQNSEPQPNTTASRRRFVDNFRLSLTDSPSGGRLKPSRHAFALIAELATREEQLLAALREARPGMGSSAEQSAAESCAGGSATNARAEDSHAAIDLALMEFGENV